MKIKSDITTWTGLLTLRGQGQSTHTKEVTGRQFGLHDICLVSAQEATHQSEKICIVIERKLPN